MNDVSNTAAVPFVLEPTTIHGKYVTLVPLTEDHAERLFAIGQDPAMWRYMVRGPFQSVADTRAFIRDALKELELGHEVPFAMLTPDGQLVGSTRYLDIRRSARGVEGGWTFLVPQYQRKKLGTESYYLLARHAFERGAVRFCMKTDERNVASMSALEAAGATKEGVLRRHTRMQDGFLRNTVYFSVLDNEWPEMRRRIETFLGIAPQ